MYKPRMELPISSVDDIDKYIKDGKAKLANLVDKINQGNDSDNHESYSQQLDTYIDAIDSIKATNRFVGKLDPLINPYSHLSAEPNKSAEKVIEWEIGKGTIIKIKALQSDTEELRDASKDLMEQKKKLMNEIPTNIKKIVNDIYTGSLSMFSSAKKNLESLIKQEDSLSVHSREYYLDFISKYKSLEESHDEYKTLHSKIGSFIDKAYSRYDGEYIDYHTYRAIHDNMDLIELTILKLESDILPDYKKEKNNLIKKINDIGGLGKDINKPEVLITLINDQNMSNSDSSYTLNNMRYDIPRSLPAAGMFAKNSTL